MSAVTSPSEPAASPSTHGVAEVSFADHGGRTRLDHLYHRDPARILFPAPAAGDITGAAVVTTSGGLVGGDRLEVRAVTGRNARALVMAQAAEKVYRSLGDDSEVRISLDAAEGSWLEWLPQETILFDGSRLDRKTVVTVSPGARVLAGDILVFGRIARGETLTHGTIRDAWEVRRGERLVWADTLHVDGDIESALVDPARFDGATAYATAVYAADDPAAHLDTARALLAREGDDVRAGATIVNELLVASWLGQDAHRLRQAFGRFWSGFRHIAGGLPEALPRLWHV